MYPTISDLLRDLLGLNIPLPVQTFGFFMALSFAAAFWATQKELQRKETNGLLASRLRTITKNKQVTTADYITNVLIGALLGYKLLEMVLNYGELVANPQEFLLSTRGSLVGALVGGGYAWYSKKQEHDKVKDKQPEQVQVTEHPYELMGNVLGIAAIAGLLGAKIFHNLEYPEDFAKDPVGALLSFSGLTFYGGLIVAAIAILYYTGKNGIPALPMMDAAAPGLMLAYGMGRVGCQLSGDGDWGIVNTAEKPLGFLPDWFWKYNYPHNVVKEGIPIPGCEGTHCFMLPDAVYPTPLYEAIAGILLFVFLWNIRKRITVPGVLFGVYLIVNGIERFLIEKIRVNSTYEIFGAHITQAELISALFVLTGIAMVVYLPKRKHNA